MTKIMMIRRILILSVALISAASILAACGAQSTPQPAFTETTIPATLTPLPPTDVPTETTIPTETSTPALELGPEERATSIEQVVGRWAFKAAGGGGERSCSPHSGRGRHNQHGWRGRLSRRHESWSRDILV